MFLEEVKATLKTGDEPLTFNGANSGFTLLDFWKWSVSDILSNTTRGRLAEFIVATSVKIDITKIRSEWDAFDLTTTDGIKIEVKSAAYLQTWLQYVVSKISFSVKLSHKWDWDIDKRSTIAQRHADVYVFCLLKHNDKRTVDPLNMDHWDFFILATSELNNYKRSQHSITLKSLMNLTEAVSYTNIHSAVITKNKLNLNSTFL